MARQIALLRGINLGPSRRLAMGELRDALARAGYPGARTLLQSGNVALPADAPPPELERALQALILAEFGMEVPVVVRTRDELAEVVARDPLGHVAQDPKRYQVTFLSDEPDPEVVRELTAADVAPERVEVIGREIYAWHPNGIQRSPLAKLLVDRRLGPGATARNWSTVTKLLALADEG